MDGEKIFYIIQPLFITISQQIKNRIELPELDKGYKPKPTVNIIGNKAGICVLSPLPFYVVLMSPPCNKAKKGKQSKKKN